MEEQKRIVEINGVKVEVDLRTAKRVDTFAVGNKVKILIKDYSDYKSFYGVIIGFDEFAKLPTLIVAYIKYSDIDFKYVNAKSEDVEICHLNDADFLNLNAEDILYKMNNEIHKRNKEIEDYTNKINFFKKHMEETFKITLKEN